MTSDLESFLPVRRRQPLLRMIGRALVLVLGLLLVLSQAAVAQETPPTVRILASDPPSGGGLSQAKADMTRESMQAARAAADDEGGFGFGLVIMLMGWSIPGYIVLQIHTLRKYRDGWRKAALVPLIATIPAFGHALIALAANSNLWPLVMLFVTPLAFLYLVGLVIVRRVRT